MAATSPQMWKSLTMDVLRKFFSRHSWSTEAAVLSDFHATQATMYNITSLLLLLVLMHNMNRIMLTTSSSLSNKSSLVFLAGLSHVWLSSVNPALAPADSNAQHTPSPTITTSTFNNIAYKLVLTTLQIISHVTITKQATNSYWN